VKETLRLGTIAGLRVGVNWSVLAIFLLLLMGLAGAQFPTAYPGLGTATYVVAGLVAALVFFGSLLAHELAHAIVARRNGMEVEGITLWLFGGVAKLRGESRSPGDEIRMAAVGPLVSVVAAVVFGVAAWLVEQLAGPGITVGVLRWLSVINGILAVFNLFPAAPLDGGRILRGYLWKRHGDRHAATITASRAGKGFGWFLIGLGLFQFIGAGAAGGLWMALIGWFLTNAAGMEEQHARMQSALGNVRVADVMTPNPETVTLDLTIQELLEEHLLRSRWSSYPVLDTDGHLAGLITLSQVKQVPRQAQASLTVADVACSTDDVPVARPGEPLSDLLPRLAGCSDGRALVVEDGHVVGIVSPTDIMRRIELANLSAPGGEHV
jgi:Zn-dependent protease/CBS domain-containing protein